KPERALLDQVEEREALVPVVLRDRDHKTQVRLDHVRLRAHVAALDALRELDLLRRCQQRVTPCLPQEELQGVGRRLVGRLERGKRWLLLLLSLLLLDDDVASPSLELVEQR